MLKAYTDHTVEHLFHRHTTRSQIIYLVALLSVLVAGVAMCFIKVPVTVQARGLVRPCTEQTEIKSVVSERIEAIYISEGQAVQRGDTLLTLCAEKIHISMAEIQVEIKKLKVFISDLEILLSKNETPNLISTYYRAQEASYRRHLFALETRLVTAQKVYQRSKNLFENRSIALADMEQEEQSYRNMISEKELLMSEQRTRWEDELTRYRASLNEFESRYQQYGKDILNYTLIAPVSGTIEKFSGIYAGNFILAGGIVAVISPTDSILIECYVHPKDIAFVRQNDIARVQIDAFPYTEWGMLEAQVAAISDDYHVMNDTPMFRVRCIPKTEQLYLKNGFPGTVKKGMTALVRFPVTERRLYQLLFDNINDWLNPSLN